MNQISYLIVENNKLLTDHLVNSLSLQFVLLIEKQYVLLDMLIMYLGAVQKITLKLNFRKFNTF